MTFHRNGQIYKYRKFNWSDTNLYVMQSVELNLNNTQVLDVKVMINGRSDFWFLDASLLLVFW